MVFAVRILKDRDYTALAKQLQRAESELMIKGVVGRCKNELGHAFVATIHDSILTLPQHVPAVRRFIEEEFGRVRLKPSIKNVVGELHHNGVRSVSGSGSGCVLVGPADSADCPAGGPRLAGNPGWPASEA